MRARLPAAWQGDGFPIGFFPQTLTFQISARGLTGQ
jgi:hypothetical protein